MFSYHEPTFIGKYLHVLTLELPQTGEGAALAAVHWGGGGSASHCGGGHDR